MIRLMTAPLLLALAFSANASETKAKEDGAKDERVCFEQARTGSNIKRKVCMSKEEAEKRREADQAAMDSFKRGSSGRSQGNKKQGVN